MRLMIKNVGLGIIFLGMAPWIYGAIDDEYFLAENWKDVDVLELSNVEFCVMPQMIRLSDECEGHACWNRVESILQSQSLNDIAWMIASVNISYEYVKSMPAVRPLADWLKQRRDYFDITEIAGREISVPWLFLHRDGQTWVLPVCPRGDARRRNGKAGKLYPVEPLVLSEWLQMPMMVHSSTLFLEKPQKTVVPGFQPRLIMVRSQKALETRFPDRTLPQQVWYLIPKLKKVFESEGVPQQWVWMAEVESSLNPRAKSPMGAVGLFQLMPATAKRFGLRVFPRDDRVKPEKNARAAARYLKKLYQQFGVWSLALAAYNAGEGRISRAMQQHGVGTFDELAKFLPLETRMYVPKVMATVALREDQTKGVFYVCRRP